MRKTGCMCAARYFFALKRKVNTMESSNQFLGTERIGKLMRKYAIPCIISLLVGALYLIVKTYRQLGNVTESSTEDKGG